MTSETFADPIRTLSRRKRICGLLFTVVLPLVPFTVASAQSAGCHPDSHTYPPALLDSHYDELVWWITRAQSNYPAACASASGFFDRIVVALEEARNCGLESYSEYLAQMLPVAGEFKKMYCF